MRFLASACVALALTSGCVRFGYEPVRSKLDSGVDAGMARSDGSASSADAAANGGTRPDNGNMDAAAGRGDAAGLDAGHEPGGSDRGIDAGHRSDANMPDSGGAESGTADSGSMGSGAMDSGAPDSGTPDWVVDPRWTEDCPGMPGVVFCDSFENSLSKWTYPVHTRGSTAVTTDYQRTGSYSMRASTSASTATVQSQARRGVKIFDHTMSGDLWARYYYYLPSSVTLTNKFSSAAISEYEPPYLGFSVTIFPDGVGIESGSISRKITSTTFPRDQWVCVEMHVHIHASAGLFELYMGGTNISAITGIDTLPDQGYSSFEIGIHYADFNQGPISVYSDDIILGTSRLGCM